MKLTHLLGTLALLAVASTASADQTIEITGATAFRQAAIRGIVQLYRTSGNTLTDIAHTGTSNSATGHEGASDAIFRGTITTLPSLTGITTIRCSWSGSVEGILAVRNQVSENYLNVSNFGTGTGYTPNDASGVAMTGINATYGVTAGQSGDTDSEMAFSDVFGTSTPYDTSAMQDNVVGVVPFFAVINDGAPATYTNITAQKFGQLAVAGFLPAKYIFPGGGTTNVYLTGRNDASGSRTTYLAHTRGGASAGFGRNQVEKGDVATVVNQWKPAAAVSDEIPSLQYWPGDDTVDPLNNSNIWGNFPTNGNGGFSSGGTVASRLAAKTSSVQLKNAGGTNVGSPVALHLVSIVGLGDAITAQNGSARILAWEGVPMTVTTAGIDATEQQKIIDGSYTLWSYERLFANGAGVNALTTGEQNLYNYLVANIKLTPNIGSSGVNSDSMAVQKTNDGVDVTPK